MAPISTVWGTDRIGNSKVKDPETGMTVVLESSEGEGYTTGETISFEITKRITDEWERTAGFSARGSYRSLDKPTHPPKLKPFIGPIEPSPSPNLETSVDFAFWDNEVGTIVVVGTWDPESDFVRSIPQRGGDLSAYQIFGKQFLLTDEALLGISGYPELSEKLGVPLERIKRNRYLGVNSESALDSAWVIGSPDRKLVEREIRVQYEAL